MDNVDERPTIGCDIPGDVTDITDEITQFLIDKRRNQLRESCKTYRQKKKDELEFLRKENVALRAENSRLKQELAASAH